MEERNCPRCHRRVLAIGLICPKCRRHFLDSSDSNSVPSLVQDGPSQNRSSEFCLSANEWKHAKLLFSKVGYEVTAEERFRVAGNNGFSFWLITAIPSHSLRGLWQCSATGSSLLKAGADLFRLRLYCDPVLRRLFQKDPFPEVLMMMKEIPATSEHPFAMFLRHPWTGTLGL